MNKVERQWGAYIVIAQDTEGKNGVVRWKLKKLVINPNSRSSMQRHFKRAEFWVYLSNLGYRFVRKGRWHQLINNTDAFMEMIELQVGEDCSEDDIERKDETNV